MKKSVLYTLWAILFVLCAALGFIPSPQGALKVLMVILSVAFFVPPFLLVRSGDRHAISLVRNLALLALILALVLLVLNILSASFSETAGTILYYILIIAASPMVCSQYWALVLFLWAYVMIDAWKELKQK